MNAIVDIVTAACLGVYQLGVRCMFYSFINTGPGCWFYLAPADATAYSKTLEPCYGARRLALSQAEEMVFPT